MHKRSRLGPGLNICAIIVRITKYKSIIKKKKEHDEIALLAKTKLDCIKGLICRPLIDSYIGHSNFLLIDELRKFDMKEGLNNLKLQLLHILTNNVIILFEV